MTQKICVRFSCLINWLRRKTQICGNRFVYHTHTHANINTNPNTSSFVCSIIKISFVKIHFHLTLFIIIYNNSRWKRAKPTPHNVKFVNRFEWWTWTLYYLLFKHFLLHTFDLFLFDQSSFIIVTIWIKCSSFDWRRRKITLKHRNAVSEKKLKKTIYIKEA